MNMTTFEVPWCAPFYEEVAVPSKPNLIHPVENTQELLQEFETVYNTVHYTHLSPQLPMPQVPFKQEQIFPPVMHQLHIAAAAVPYYNYAPNVSQINVPSSPEIEFVDEIVRSRCQDLTVDIPWTTEDDNTSSSSTYSSSGLSPLHSESDSCYGGSDEEYSRRSKPYDRPIGTDDKRSRKKEQNKNAATRYRQKKKQEVEEILVEEKRLSDVHDGLEKSYQEVKREVKYLKCLMRELFKSQGLLD